MNHLQCETEDSAQVVGAHRSIVLVAKDNQDIVIKLQDLLRADGYAVSAAESRTSAIAHVPTQQFTAILLHPGLPDGDGLDVLRAIQRRASSLPAVIVTAYVSPDRTAGSPTTGGFARGL